ncbi:phosphoribosyltransferase [Desertimonas flava]|uniref:phosphoribosyltransferase n=1 Tax=Desertimonas flava TaxID=2064846 RepID=UPI000E34F6B3|nr:phosphoribosyltransferase family protein [Desertimonas flava]
MVRRRFAHRLDAGEQLASLLASRHVDDDVVVVGLPRGGVIVAAPVARRLGAPLDLLVARKIGAPGHEEFGIGAVAEGGGLVLDEASVRVTGVTPHELDELIAAERRRVDERVERYCAGRERQRLAGRHVLVVDDGLATGVTARAALQSVRSAEAAAVTLAIPVGPPDSIRAIGDLADEVVAVIVARNLRAVGEFYDRFEQTTDDEVIAALDEQSRHRDR